MDVLKSIRELKFFDSESGCPSSMSSVNNQDIFFLEILGNPDDFLSYLIKRSVAVRDVNLYTFVYRPWTDRLQDTHSKEIMNLLIRRTKDSKKGE